MLLKSHPVAYDVRGEAFTVETELQGWTPLPWESERAESFSTGETENLRIAELCRGFHPEKPQPREGKSLLQGHTGTRGLARTRNKIGMQQPPTSEGKRSDGSGGPGLGGVQ